MGLKVQIVSREEILFECEAEYVSVPSVGGALCVLPGRQPVLAALEEGPVVIKMADGSEKLIDVGPGFASVDSDVVSVVVDTMPSVTG